ncbi:unnamed protein product [Adineta ricciae]|uniref:Rhamnogalacturonase A/B/Epimerase-like pectate lyase domain-containing protein n=1 Tax=Adineta ricciae TaxID=249248 RepID=A0A814D7D4_ADIRI|nr:unnamed protein product [Adineta ricciae]
MGTMKLVCGWLVVILLLMKQSSIEGKKIFVSKYGAHPNDDLDDTAAIQLTINEAIKRGYTSEIVFGFGIYAISSTIIIQNAINLTITGEGIDQTYLIAYNQVSIFFAENCQGLKFTSFSIDYNPLPFTAGYIANIGDTFLDVRVVSPHQTDVDRQAQAILRYDPDQKRPAFGQNTYEMYQTPPADRNTTIVEPGVLRVPLSARTEFRQGDPVVVRYAFRGHAIYGQDLTDISVQSIAIYTSWGMGFVTLRSRRLQISNYHVLPRDGRWMSTIVDCLHFFDTREYLSITDSECHAMGDDGLNVHGVFFLVTNIIDDKTIIIQTKTSDEPLNFAVGTNLEFSANQQPFVVHGSGQVASITSTNSTDTRKITFTNPVNVTLNDWVCVADTPMLTIRNFTVANNRARGVLLETRNIDIRQSLFYRTSGPAVLIQPSMYWHEGPEAQNVSLVGNVYIENNEGIAQGKGVITILPDPVHLVPVINDIRIESSSFYLGLSSQGLLQSNNMNNLYLTHNYIATNLSAPIISICNSRNISAANNCVVNMQTKIIEYYTFDQTSPCSMNLSSLIDLPPSAFNASFPPPAITDKKFY